MTEEFLQRLRKKPGDHDGDTGGDALTAGIREVGGVIGEGDVSKR